MSKKNFPTSIKENKTGSSFELYPNPAQNEILFNLNTDAVTAEMQISNVLGSVVLSQKINNTAKPVTVSVSELTDGIYFLHVNDGKQEQVKQFVVKH